MEKLVKCKVCENEMAKSAKICPHCGAKNKMPFYKKWWVWVIAVVVIIGIAGSNGDESITTNVTNTDVNVLSGENGDGSKILVADFSAMDMTAIETWSKDNSVTCVIEKEYSDVVEKDKFISQSIKPNDMVKRGCEIKISISLGKEPSIEFKNALKKAESYSKIMHMSKQGIYDQLTSEYGEKFPAEAAQYAIDNMEVDWKANALEKARSYQKTMSMSNSAIYDQLISEYGEKFTAEEAQYAIDNLNK